MALRKNYVFLVAGQSNALGAGSDMANAASPTYDRYIGEGGGEQLEVRYRQMSACGNDYPSACGTETYAWKRLECVSPIGNRTFGPEISLGRELYDLMGIGTTEDANLWIVKCATGSTTMDDWHPTDYVGDTRLYQRMLEFYNESVTLIQNNAGTPGQVIFGGLLWCQGESDAANATQAADYETHLQEFITQFRLDFGTGTEPISIMRLGTNQSLTYKADVITGQNAAVTNNTNVTIVDMDGCTVNSGSPPHWDEEGYFYLGASAAHQFAVAHGWKTPVTSTQELYDAADPVQALADAMGFPFTPDYLWLGNSASSPVAEEVGGSLSLTETGTALDYQQDDSRFGNADTIVFNTSSDELTNTDAALDWGTASAAVVLVYALDNSGATGYICGSWDGSIGHRNYLLSNGHRFFRIVTASGTFTSSVAVDHGTTNAQVDIAVRDATAQLLRYASREGTASTAETTVSTLTTTDDFNVGQVRTSLSAEMAVSVVAKWLGTQAQAITATHRQNLQDALGL